MNILLTTGTTDFNELIDSALQLLTCDKLIIQSPVDLKVNSLSKIKEVEYISFADNILELYQWADIVITHAGAGSVFKLLELEKSIVVVPNQFRADKHQLQLANYVFQENYASVCFELNEIQDSVNLALNTSYCRYENEEFSGEEDIINLLFHHKKKQKE